MRLAASALALLLVAGCVAAAGPSPYRGPSEAEISRVGGGAGAGGGGM